MGKGSLEKRKKCGIGEIEMKPLHWILAVDLDGVILDFDLDYWFKHKGYFGKVKKGCVEALKKFRKMGYKIIVYTARIDGDRL